MNRQEKVNLAHRKLGQKDQTRAKSEENSSSTRKLDASLPEFGEHEILESSTHGKDISMLTKEIGKVFTQCYVLNRSKRNKCNDMENVHGVVDESRPPSWDGFPDEFGNLQDTRFENIGNVFNITRKLMKEYSEEILNVECLGCSSPSWTRSILVNDQAIKWTKAKACVYADSVLCVGRRNMVKEQQKDGKAKLKISGCVHHIKMQWESMEKQLNSSGIFSQDSYHCLFF